MSDSNSWFKQTPSWVWLSLIPTVGGFAIVYAGYKSNTKSWIVLGLGVAGFALFLSYHGFGLLVLPIQVVTAFLLKEQFLAKIYPANLPIPKEPRLAQLVASRRKKIDINQCSKNELVNGLGLPIVYANNIELLLNEGYIFTHAEELTEIAGIPKNQVDRIAPMLIFSYDYKLEAEYSWKKLNVYSTQELIACGLDAAIAQKIIAERSSKGEFKSLIEVKQRTGLPLSTYRHIT